MRFTLYIDTDRAPDGPTTWDHLIKLVVNEMERIGDYKFGDIDPTPLMKIRSYDGYFTIGGYKVTKGKSE